MAIHEENLHITTGTTHNKKLDANAIEMIMANLQRSQYQFPIKSTVRELVSNGVDSIAEKNMARAILSGEAKVEDYFVEREGDVYKDSKWTPDYYNLEWLDTKDEVEIRYVCGPEMQKDRIVISDTGIGLGANRLENYFNLGWSSKRLNKLPLGKFGVGAKAPLSTDVDFYTMETRYNGFKYRFNIYNSTIDSIIPRFDLTTGQENSFILFNAGTKDEYKVYREGTIMKNGVSVSLETKKHHKPQYIDAVKSQLLYFNNLRLVIQHETGQLEDIAYKANILYEDNDIVLSDNSYWSKPHILLNKVNYGYVAFDELELEQKNGNIGIKVEPEDVEVNPSRESLRWSEKTKAKVVERFNKVVEIATSLLQIELDEPDFLKWMKTVATVTSAVQSRNDVIGRLAKVADLSQINPSFKGDERIKAKGNVFEGLYMRSVGIDSEQRANQFKTVIKRKEIKDIKYDLHKPIYLMENDERASNRKDKWLMASHPQGFLQIYAPFLTVEKMILAGMSEEFIDRFKAHQHKLNDDKKGKIVLPIDIYNLLSESAGVTEYSQVEVPEGFTGNEEDEEVKTLKEEKEAKTEEAKQVVKVKQLTAQERRKADGKILLYTPKTNKHIFAEIDAYYTMQKIEVPIASINDWDAEEVFYATDADDELLHFVAMLSRDPIANNTFDRPKRTHSDGVVRWTEKKWWRLNTNGTSGSARTKIGGLWAQDAFLCQHFYDSNDIILVKVSKANVKYVRDFLPIQQFFMQIKQGVITMSNLLIKWNTARIIKQKLNKAAFLNNFNTFNSKLASKYKELRDYIDRNYRHLEPKQNAYGFNEEIYSNLITHLDNVKQFQDYVRTFPTETTTIAAMAQTLFGNPHISDGMAVDPAMIVLLEEVLNYADSVGTMLNYIPYLTNVISNIPEDLELEIKKYLDFKGVLDYGQELLSGIPQSPLLGTSVVETKLELMGSTSEDTEDGVLDIQ